MTVYADILFLVNLSLNWFSLILTSKIMKLKSSAAKMILAAAAGALAGVFTVFFPETLPVALIEIASTFLMCAIAFKAFGLWGYIKICTCLFASGITIGGSLTLIYSFFNRSGIELQRQNDLSTAVFILLSFAVTVAALIFERIVSADKNISTGELTVEYAGNRITVPYFCDSGNFLCEPISGRPAIIMNSRELGSLLGREIPEFDPLSPDPAVDDSFRKRLRLLPASTVCGESIMLGFIPDRIVIDPGRAPKEVDAIIAIDKTPLKTVQKANKAIVPPSLI